MKRSKVFYLSSLSVVFAFCVFVFMPGVSWVEDKAGAGGSGGGEPQAKDENNDPKELTPGVIASSGNFNSRGVSLDVALNSGITDKKLSPINARLSTENNGRCGVTVSNASKKSTYSMYLAAEAFDGGKRAGGRSFTTTLAPGKSSSHEFPCKPGQDLRVVLKSGQRRG